MIRSNTANGVDHRYMGNCQFDSAPRSAWRFVRDIHLSLYRLIIRADILEAISCWTSQCKNCIAIRWWWLSMRGSIGLIACSKKIERRMWAQTMLLNRWPSSHPGSRLVQFGKAKRELEQSMYTPRQRKNHARIIWLRNRFPFVMPRRRRRVTITTAEVDCCPNSFSSTIRVCRLARCWRA